jgi:hypothetical protein
MTVAATIALTRLGLRFVDCDACGQPMRQPDLDWPKGNQYVIWPQKKKHFDPFYYVCSPGCRRRVKEGRVVNG